MMKIGDRVTVNGVPFVGEAGVVVGSHHNGYDIKLDSDRKLYFFRKCEVEPEIIVGAKVKVSGRPFDRRVGTVTQVDQNLGIYEVQLDGDHKKLPYAKREVKIEPSHTWANIDFNQKNKVRELLWQIDRILAKNRVRGEKKVMLEAVNEFYGQ